MSSKGKSVTFVFFMIIIFNSQLSTAEAVTLRVPEQYPTIQSAINAANSGDVIEVSHGEYMETINFTSKSDITLRGVDTQAVVLNANNIGRAVGIYVSSKIKISNLTITRGSATGTGDNIYGGGIFVDGSTGVEVSGNSITNNTGVNGGGVALRNSTVSLVNNLIQNNIAKSSSEARGGGVFIYLSHGVISNNQILNNTTQGPTMAPGGGMFLQLSDPIISNNVFSGNRTSGAQHYGGGLYIYDSRDFQVNDNIFIANSGLDGGGMAVIESNVTISNNRFGSNNSRWGAGLYGWHMGSAIEGNTFIENTATDGGGGVLFDESSQSIFRKNIVRGNQSSNWGGGLDLYKSSCRIEENEISQNQSYQGGGIAATPDSDATIINNVIIDNVATHIGGGLAIGDRSNVVIMNNLIARNEAIYSGGGIVIFGNSSPQIINNTIFSNRARQHFGGGIRVDSSTPVIMNNIITGHTSSEGISAANSNFTPTYNNFWDNLTNYEGVSPGNGSISDDPRFANSRAGDFHLGSGSSSMNSGNPDPTYNNLDGTRNHMGMYGGAHPLPSVQVFKDVMPSYWSFNYIYSIYFAGITLGCGDCNYCPGSEVTRGQMAAFIIRAKYGEEFSYTTTPYFSDVPSTNTFFKYIQKMKDEGITAVSGVYGVESGVTRGQMAAFIIRARYGENFSYTTTPYFNDVPNTHPFFKYVQKLKDTGITRVSGTYGVDEVVTREQMAAFIARAFLDAI